MPSLRGKIVRLASEMDYIASITPQQKYSFHAIIHFIYKPSKVKYTYSIFIYSAAILKVQSTQLLISYVKNKTPRFCHDTYKKMKMKMKEAKPRPRRINQFKVNKSNIHWAAQPMWFSYYLLNCRVGSTYGVVSELHTRTNRSVSELEILI